MTTRDAPPERREPVGIRLFVEVLECAPADLTWRERYALAVLAENANDGTRECWPGIEDDPGIAHRMRLPGRSSRYEVIKALREKKALEVVSSGHRGHRAVYRIPSMGLGKGPGTPDAIDEKGSGDAGQSVQEPRTQTTGKGPDSTDPMSEKGSGFSGQRVRDSPGKGPGTPDPFPSDPSTPSRESFSQRGEGHEQERDYAMRKFGSFWLTYPKRKAKEDAITEWKAAIDRGVDPDHMVDGAKRYAGERKDQDPYFTKLPATWLRKGCYDDEPDPESPANSGNGPGPHRNPENESDYHQGWN